MSNVLAVDAANELDTVEDIEMFWAVGDERPHVGRAVIQHLMHIAAGDCLTWEHGGPVNHESYLETGSAPMGGAYTWRGGILARVSGTRNGRPAVAVRRTPVSGPGWYLVASMATVTGTSCAAFIGLALDETGKRTGCLFAPEVWGESEAFYTALERVGTPRHEIVESLHEGRSRLDPDQGIAATTYRGGRVTAVPWSSTDHPRVATGHAVSWSRRNAPSSHPRPTLAQSVPAGGPGKGRERRPALRGCARDSARHAA